MPVSELFCQEFGSFFIGLALSYNLELLNLWSELLYFAHDKRLTSVEVVVELVRNRDQALERKLLAHMVLVEVHGDGAFQRDIEGRVWLPMDVVFVSCQDAEVLHNLVDRVLAGVVENVQSASEMQVQVDLVAILELHLAHAVILKTACLQEVLVESAPKVNLMSV